MKYDMNALHEYYEKHTIKKAFRLIIIYSGWMQIKTSNRNINVKKLSYVKRGFCCTFFNLYINIHNFTINKQQLFQIY